MKFLFENGMYAAVADPGMVINYGDGYCHKLYRTTDDFSDCVQMAAPIEEEEITDTEALGILLGGAV